MCQGCLKAPSMCNTAGHRALRRISHRGAFNANLRRAEESLYVSRKPETQEPRSLVEMHQMGREEIITQENQ